MLGWKRGVSLKKVKHDSDYETALRNFVEGINHVKSEPTRSALRLCLEAECHAIIKSVENKYEPFDSVKETNA